MPMRKNFVKMHGLGNDFAIFDGRTDGFDLSPDQIRAYGHRNTGIGFDQMVIIRPATDPATAAYLKIYNADGSEVGACGNATRCVGALLMAALKKNDLSVETQAGQLKVWNKDGKISVDMGAAKLGWQDIPLSQDTDTLSLPLEEGTLKNPTAVSMGNPHAVFFVEDVAAVPLDTLGPKIEHHKRFPQKTNVEIVQILAKDKIRMRVWERGTGITLACGTGACAAVVAAVRRGLTDRKVTVILDGGELEIEWREEDGHVLMTGDVALAYRGELDFQ